MKGWVLFVLLTVVLLSCQQRPAEQGGQKEQRPAEVATQQVAQAKDAEALAQQKGCMACHAKNEKKVGPSYAAVAQKYAGRADAVDYLAGKIKNGGVGVWGQVPMPAQNVTDQEARDLAKWVLSTK